MRFGSNARMDARERREEDGVKLERIVVAVDFSPSSIDAAHWIAGRVGPQAELVLAHIIAIPDPPRTARAKFPQPEVLAETVRQGADRRLRELSPSLGVGRIWLEIREGEMARGLVEVAREYSADLLVVGAHGERKGVLSGLGGTAEAVVRLASMPVLVVVSPTQPPLRRILVPVDDSDMTDRVLRVARALGESSGADVTALYVVGSAVMSHVLSATAMNTASPEMAPDALRERVRSDADGWMAGMLKAGAKEREGMKADIAFGDPAQEIVATARAWSADLIVMGRRGAGNFRRAVLGSVVNGVLRHAPCPVLVCPSEDDAAAT